MMIHTACVCARTHGRFLTSLKSLRLRSRLDLALTQQGEECDIEGGTTVLQCVQLHALQVLVAHIRPGARSCGGLYAFGGV